MTTTVTVSAHCDPETTQVRVSISGDQLQEDMTILQDRESAHFHVYDGREITVREVPNRGVIGDRMNEQRLAMSEHKQETCAKLDHGKPRLGLVLLGFSRALQAVGEVGTFGAKKYTDDGWVMVPDGRNRYTDALLRHLIAEGEGYDIDHESGLHHAVHTAWNALARLDLMLRQGEGQREQA